MLSYYVSLRSEFRVVMSGSSLPPGVCRRAHVLSTLFVYSGVQHILWCVFVLFFLCLPHVARFHGLSILIVPSVFSNVYFNTSQDLCGASSYPMPWPFQSGGYISWYIVSVFVRSHINRWIVSFHAVEAFLSKHPKMLGESPY